MKDDFDDPADGGFDFEPAVPAAAPRRERTPRVGKRAGGMRRKLAGAAVLGIALIGMGGAFTLLAGNSGAADTTSSAADVQAVVLTAGWQL